MTGEELDIKIDSLKALKADELMVGDYVRQKHSGLLLQVSEVVPPYIRAKGMEGQFHEDTIEAIRLTREMIEDNGWHEKYISGYFDADVEQNLEISMHWFQEYKDGRKTPVWSICSCQYVVMPFWFVHELQHALKLNRIKLEFKVNRLLFGELNYGG